MEWNILFYSIVIWKTKKGVLLLVFCRKKAGNIPFPSSQKKKNSQLGKKRKTNDLNIIKKYIHNHNTQTISHNH